MLTQTQITFMRSVHDTLYDYEDECVLGNSYNLFDVVVEDDYIEFKLNGNTVAWCSWTSCEPNNYNATMCEVTGLYYKGVIVDEFLYNLLITS